VRGVFVVNVQGLGPRARAGVASVGQRPTVDASGRWLLEVHLLDFAADAYGALVSVEFIEKLREERKYDTLEALTAAIRTDAERARTRFGNLAIP
jgi:riboflavin kinase/FMN adenylyltransferase